MSSRSLLWTLLLALTGLGLWWAHDRPGLQRGLWQALREGQQPLATKPTAAATAPTTAPPPAAALRKCRVPGRVQDGTAGGVLYTDGNCPAGARVEALDGGSLSVLPAAPAAPVPDSASAVPALRRLAGPDDSAAARERVLDQALQR